MRDQHEFFMNVAKNFATRSTCARKQVGAILVRDGRIISSGYNGVLSGCKHCNETHFGAVDWERTALDDEISKDHHLFSSVNELHAEQNVIAFAARNGVSTENCTLYTTLAPCPDCSKLIAAAGIKEVFYSDVYDRSGSGITFLEKHGIRVTQIDEIYQEPLAWIVKKGELLTKRG